MRQSPWICGLTVTGMLLALASCLHSWAEHTLRQLVKTEGPLVAMVSRRFLADTTIRNIGIAVVYDPMLGESVNGWTRFRRSGPWKNWDLNTNKYVFANTVQEVLKREEIPLSSYRFYTDMLQRTDTHTISRVVECADCVDFEIGVHGLRYARDSSYQLQQDHEYLRVERLTPHWHLYTRDWN